MIAGPAAFIGVDRGDLFDRPTSQLGQVRSVIEVLVDSSPDVIEADAFLWILTLQRHGHAKLEYMKAADQSAMHRPQHVVDRLANVRSREDSRHEHTVGLENAMQLLGELLMSFRERYRRQSTVDHREIHVSI